MKLFNDAVTYSSKDIKELSKQMDCCPFCKGNKTKITSMSKGSIYGEHYYQGLCNRCFARGPKVSDPFEALGLWNVNIDGFYRPPYHVNKELFDKFLRGEVVLRCTTQLEFNTVLSDIEEQRENFRPKGLLKYFSKYNKDVCIDSRALETQCEEFFWCDKTEQYEKDEHKIIEKVIIEHT
jgi:hypothetical protein